MKNNYNGLSLKHPNVCSKLVEMDKISSSIESLWDVRVNKHIVQSRMYEHPHWHYERVAWKNMWNLMYSTIPIFSGDSSREQRLRRYYIFLKYLEKIQLPFFHVTTEKCVVKPIWWLRRLLTLIWILFQKKEIQPNCICDASHIHYIATVIQNTRQQMDRFSSARLSVVPQHLKVAKDPESW